ncbi:MAG: ParB/RepB/Spo0J family partition protein, partial [Candidatus Binatia bacterium]
GERRLRAARLAGLDAVPVTVRDYSDRESLEIALIENLQRDDLSALEEAAGFQRLIDDFALTQDEVAQRVGKSRPAVANTLRLLQLPDAVREELRSGRLSAGHARALLALSSEVEQAALARETVRRGLSVRQLEALIRLRSRERAARRSTANLHVADVERQLGRSLGTKVRLLGRGAKGKIVIEYYSADERERLIERLRK